ncbi:MAG: bifunctional molybdenum cofactor biosynthesis protein MoaC/MoaB, partial [Candidatus Saccharibacteria bacterium]|nr:bifunctional molybdenum cofactor biosynthesis protein MoaC/MoaB [Microbacteriaceae bacterium]
RARGLTAPPTAALSRAVAGTIKGTVVGNRPGSTGGGRGGLAVLEGLHEHLVAQTAGGGAHE